MLQILVVRNRSRLKGIFEGELGTWTSPEHNVEGPQKDEGDSKTMGDKEGSVNAKQFTPEMKGIICAYERSK